MKNIEEKSNKVTVILLAGKGDSTNILYNYFKDKINFSSIIVEEKPSKKKLLKNRAKRIGFIKVFGQLIFSLFVVKILKKIYSKRIKNILQVKLLDNKEIPSDKINYVETVNSDMVRNIIKETDADFVLVNGTRIIGKKTLESKDIKFINTHAGITPKYRGVHGGYWALVKGDLEHCGVTVHYVDTGVDTGNVIGHLLIKPSKKDSFVTYPFLQLNKGIEILELFFKNYLKGDTNMLNKINAEESKQFYHPTIFEYFSHLINRGVK